MSKLNAGNVGCIGRGRKWVAFPPNISQIWPILLPIYNDVGGNQALENIGIVVARYRYFTPKKMGTAKNIVA